MGNPDDRISQSRALDSAVVDLALQVQDLEHKRNLAARALACGIVAANRAYNGLVSRPPEPASLPLTAERLAYIAGTAWLNVSVEKANVRPPTCNDLSDLVSETAEACQVDSLALVQACVPIAEAVGLGSEVPGPPLGPGPRTTCRGGDEMTWFKLDDKCAFHSKVLAAGNEAFGVWCRAGSWSSGELLDGFVPEHVALQIGTKKLWGKLETCGGKDRAGLVEKVDGGWRIHDFERYNPKALRGRAEARGTSRKAQEGRRVGECQAMGGTSQERPTCFASGIANGSHLR